MLCSCRTTTMCIMGSSFHHTTRSRHPVRREFTIVTIQSTPSKARAAKCKVLEFSTLTCLSHTRLLGSYHFQLLQVQLQLQLWQPLPLPLVRICSPRKTLKLNSPLKKSSRSCNSNSGCFWHAADAATAAGEVTKTAAAASEQGS